MLTALCIFFNENNISGTKAKLVGQMEPKVSEKMMSHLNAWLDVHADVKVCTPRLCLRLFSF